MNILNSMNVYDFDGTIYNGDSTRDYFHFLVKKYPKVISVLPKFFLYFFLYKLHLNTKTKAKEKFYHFLTYFSADKTRELVSEFWDINEVKIFDYYHSQKKDDDVIISASPRFILSTICDRLKINKLICSEVDSATGIYDGLNCHGEEKVKRFYKEYPNGIIDEFYSDSYSDLPLAKIAKKAFLVDKEGNISNWII